MAILMSYHKLVERDSKNVDVHWKAGSIILLVISIVCSLSVSLSLQKITSAYENQCLLGADLKFENISDDLVSMTMQNEFEGPKLNGDEFLDVSNVFNSTHLNFLGLRATDKIRASQAEKLKNHQINERLTNWGNKNKCDFAIYSPICQSCFAIIVMTMFIICGKGGKADESAYLQEPWRIVSPALFFFVVMTIFSIVNLVIIETGMNTLCKSFKAEVSDVSCSASLNHFMMAPREKFNLPPGKTWIILTIFNYFTLFSWLISALILVARIIFVIDFQLMRVTVKTVEYENSKDSSNLKVIEIEDHKTDDSKSSHSISYKKMSNISIEYRKLFEEIKEEIDSRHKNDQIKEKNT